MANHELWRSDPKVATSKVWVAHVRDEREIKGKCGKRSKHLQIIRTVAAIEDGDEVHVGIAMLSPMDNNSSHKIGREIAVGRARFAFAKAMGLTSRQGRHSRFGTITTVSKDKFAVLAQSWGVNFKTEETNLWEKTMEAIQAEPEEEEVNA